MKKFLIFYKILFLIIFLQTNISAAPEFFRDLENENSGFFAGITHNSIDIKNVGSFEGFGWQAGIIQKTEKRSYGYLTGLLYFDHVMATGNPSDLGKIKLTSNDIIFSLWLTQLWGEKSSFAPAISIGPAFLFKVASSVETEQEIHRSGSLVFDLQAQLGLGSYIRVKKGVYLYPQFMLSYTLFNNNRFSEDWIMRKELNYAFQLAFLYTTDY